MDRALLDTDIFSEVLKSKNQNVVRNAAAYRHHFGCYTLSAVTIAEMVKGFQKMGREDRIQTLIAGLTAEEILPLDYDSAIIGGKIYGELEKSGKTIGRADPYCRHRSPPPAYAHHRKRQALRADNCPRLSAFDPRLERLKLHLCQLGTADTECPRLGC
jgi:predicted nucleic acid-binding protein